MSSAIYRALTMTLSPDPECIFCKIVGGQIPATIVLQTELVTAFRDIKTGYCGPYAGYTGVAGWDPCTGVGVVKGKSGK